MIWSRAIAKAPEPTAMSSTKARLSKGADSKSRSHRGMSSLLWVTCHLGEKTGRRKGSGGIEKARPMPGMIFSGLHGAASAAGLPRPRGLSGHDEYTTSRTPATASSSSKAQVARLGMIERKRSWSARRCGTSSKAQGVPGRDEGAAALKPVPALDLPKPRWRSGHDECSLLRAPATEWGLPRTDADAGLNEAQTDDSVRGKPDTF